MSKVKFKYFFFPLTNETLKKQYLDNCKKLHPDSGGNGADFIEMKKEFDKIKNLIKIKIPKRATGKRVKKNNTFAQKKINIVNVNFDINNLQSSIEELNKTLTNFFKKL